MAVFAFPSFDYKHRKQKLSCQRRAALAQQSVDRRFLKYGSIGVKLGACAVLTQYICHRTYIPVYRHQQVQINSDEQSRCMERPHCKQYL